MDYRARILSLRESKGLSQEALGKLAGVSQMAISGIESGRTREPEATTIVAIARALRVTVEYLWSGKGHVDAAQAEADEAEAVRLVRALNEEFAERWLEVGKALLRAQDAGGHPPRHPFDSNRPKPQ